MTEKCQKGNNLSHDSTLDQSISEPEELPCVLQCATCNTIIGDSTALVFTNDILRTATLKCTSDKLNVADEIVVTPSGPDAGSTYHRLACGSCEEDIGKMYICTPQKLDAERGLYTLFLDKLSSYQVGSCSKETGLTDSGSDLCDLLSLSKVRKISSHVQKLQSVVLSIDNRVSQIEEYIGDMTNVDDVSVTTGSHMTHPDITRQEVFIDHNNGHDNLHRKDHTDTLEPPHNKSISPGDINFKLVRYQPSLRPGMMLQNSNARADNSSSYSLSSVKKRYSTSQGSNKVKKAKLRK